MFFFNASNVNDIGFFFCFGPETGNFRFVRFTFFTVRFRRITPFFLKPYRLFFVSKDADVDGAIGSPELGRLGIAPVKIVRFRSNFVSEWPYGKIAIGAIRIMNEIRRRIFNKIYTYLGKNRTFPVYIHRIPENRFPNFRPDNTRLSNRLCVLIYDGGTVEFGVRPKAMGVKQIR